MALLMAAAKYTDKKVGDGHIRHHHPVGVGHSESTPAETALPARTVGASRATVKKRVAEPGSPTLSERVSAIRVG
ncbi:MAG: hypothetical protein ACI8XM_001995 [Haloarculaceae archaeon]|jgi:hypothetical protein